MAPPASPLPSYPHRPSLFTPIHEGNEKSEESDHHIFRSTTPTTTTSTTVNNHNSTPLHKKCSKSVSCVDCRPTNPDKSSVLIFPFDNNRIPKHSLSPSSTLTPNGLFKSLLAGITRRSPKPPPSLESSSVAPSYTEEQWRTTVAELSHKLVQAARKRDEAVLESSRMKYSMVELEKKLNRLEVYCHNLKSGLEICGFNHQLTSPARNNSPHLFGRFHGDDDGDKYNHDLIIKNFLVCVSDARSSIRLLSKSLTSQLKLMGVKVIERLLMILRSYDIKLSTSTNPRNLQFYLEALLNAAFYEDFETAGFEKNSTTRVLNPIERSESNYMGYKILKDLAWEEVLSKGTKHFSEEFSKFCDRKMSEIVGMLGWNRAWPEQLLQAFFGASKSVWLTHLLANSVHPTLSIFRVERGIWVDPVYMEDMGGDKGKTMHPTMVRIMVAPGFYVYDNVVKCKVLCRYTNTNTSNNNNHGVFSGNGDDNTKVG